MANFWLNKQSEITHNILKEIAHSVILSIKNGEDSKFFQVLNSDMVDEIVECTAIAGFNSDPSAMHLRTITKRMLSWLNKNCYALEDDACVFEQREINNGKEISGCRWE